MIDKKICSASKISALEMRSSASQHKTVPAGIFPASINFKSPPSAAVSLRFALVQADTPKSSSLSINYKLFSLQNRSVSLTCLALEVFRAWDGHENLVYEMHGIGLDLLVFIGKMLPEHPYLSNDIKLYDFGNPDGVWIASTPPGKITRVGCEPA